MHVLFRVNKNEYDAANLITFCRIFFLNTFFGLLKEIPIKEEFSILHVHNFYFSFLYKKYKAIFATLPILSSIFNVCIQESILEVSSIDNDNRCSAIVQLLTVKKRIINIKSQNI